MQLLLSVVSGLALSAGAFALPPDINGTIQLSEREVTRAALGGYTTHDR